MSEATGAPGGATRLMRQLVDAVDDILYVLDADGDAVFWNDQLAETTGYSDAEIEAMDPKEFLRPEQRDATPGLGEAIDALGDRRVLLDVVTKEGGTIPHEFRGTTVENPETGEPFRCGIARDVSDRVERQRELERYETIVESVDDGVYSLDDDLTFSFVNDGLCELFGRSREELLGTDPRDLFVDDDEREMAADMREAVIEGEETTGVVEAIVETPDGERRELETRYQLLREPEDGEFPGTAGVVRDVTERNRQQRKLRRQRALLQGILNTIPDVVFAFDEAIEPLAPEFMLEEFAGYSIQDRKEMDALEFIAPEDRDRIAELMGHVLETGDVASEESELITADGERVPYEFRGTRLEDEEGEVIGIVGSGRDITERVERERRLEQRRDELVTLNRINELLLEIVRELVETPSRRDLERSICERLAASDLYRFAWIGERGIDGDRVVPRVSAGDDEGYVDGLTITGDETKTGRGPGGRAFRTGEVQVANVADLELAPWRNALSALDVRSVAAVPLRHRDTVYGVLAVYATRPDAFSEREQAGFRILGETVGFVINAVKRRKLLFADAITELEFGVTDPAALLPWLSRALDCDVELDGYVDAGDRWLTYFDVSGVSADPVVDALADREAVADVRVVTNQRDHRRIEVALTEDALLDVAASVGATVTSATASDGDARVVIEVPVDADVRETVELIGDRLAGASLLARRERDRRSGRPDGPGRPLEELTPRQQEAITVAYRAGYYKWPRESTAEEVAETLDIAPATLHAHLRKAERTLLAEMVDAA